MTKHNYSRWKKEKRESKSRAIRSKEDRGQESLRFMVSIYRSTHPLLLQGEQGATPAYGSPGVANSHCTPLSKPIRCAPCPTYARMLTHIATYLPTLLHIYIRLYIRFESCITCSDNSAFYWESEVSQTEHGRFELSSSTWLLVKGN